MKINKETFKKGWSKVITFFKGIENLYLKFILTIIAVALLVIAYKLANTDLNYVEVGGDVWINGSIASEVSGSIETY